MLCGIKYSYDDNNGGDDIDGDDSDDNGDRQ